MKKIIYGAKMHSAILLSTCIAFVFLVMIGCFGSKNNPIKAQNQSKTTTPLNTAAWIKSLKFEDVFEKDKSIYALNTEYNVKQDVVSKLPYTHPDSFWVHYKHLLGLQPDMELRYSSAGEGNKNTEENSFYYHLYYKGLQVLKSYGFGEVLESSILFKYYKNLPYKLYPNLDTAFVNGKVKNINTTPKITPQQAIDTCLKAHSVKYYYWNTVFEEELKKSKGKDATFYPKPVLQFLKNDRTKQYEVVYMVRVASLVDDITFYIDIKDGHIIQRFSNWQRQFSACDNCSSYPLPDVDGTLPESEKDCNVLYYKNIGDAVVPTTPFPNLVGSGATKQVAVQTCKDGNNNEYYKLRQDGALKNIRIYDLKDDNGNPPSDICWHSETEQDIAANTFYWAFNKAYDYFEATHLWKNFNNEPSTWVNLLINNKNTSVSQIGNDNVFNIKLGRGINPITPKVSLDAVTHEYVHGIINVKAENPLKNKELGAIQEGICDVFGMVVEGQQIPIDWTVGETFLDPEVRNHKNPWASSPPQPKAYKGKNWFNEDGVVDTVTNLYFIHHNNSILGYWFYLLSNGGIGNVDDNEAPDINYTVQGIGIEKAANIVFKSIIKLKGDPDFTFDKYCKATIFLADSLYGSCSLEHVSVANAWYAVGVLPAKYNTALIAELN